MQNEKPAPDKFWEMLATLAKDGRLFAPQAVYEEVLQRIREEDLPPNSQGEVKRRMGKGVAWAREYRGIFIDNNATVTARALEILQQNWQPVPNTRRDSSVDPWIIALAEREHLTVVTADKKILTVCKNMGMPCLSVKEFLKQEGDEELANLSYP